METLERIQKLISISGHCSRREGENLVEQGRVLINGEVATVGQKASFKDQIIVDGIPIFKPDLKYFLLNKPKGYVTSLKRQRDEKIISDLMFEEETLFPIGRLDKDTSGTIIMTNDGELTNKLCHPRYEVEKVYRVRINTPLSSKEMGFLNSKNVILEGKQSLQKVQQVDTKSYVVVLKQGINHHIKKLFALVEKNVVNLTRIEFAGLTHVGKVEKGQYRRLKKAEVLWLKSDFKKINKE